MRRRQTIIFTAAVFAALFLLGQWLLVPKTYVESALLQALQSPRVLLASLKNRDALVGQLNALQLENQSLRAQLAMALARPELIAESGRAYIASHIYSTYPLNNDGIVYVAAGAAEGVTEQAVVVAEPGIFLGEVTEVYEHQSAVRTIYDPGWELPTKIGRENIDSLLVGGREPRLTLISKKRPTEQGMNVYVAAKKYPYGLLLGTLGSPADSDQNLFQEASLQTPYILSDLQRVFIMRATNL